MNKDEIYWREKAIQRLQGLQQDQRMSRGNPAWRTQSLPVSWALANLPEAAGYQRLVSSALSTPYDELGYRQRMYNTRRKAEEEKKKGKPTMEDLMTGMVSLSDALSGFERTGTWGDE